MRVVILGGGFGGANAALRLQARAPCNWTITLVNSENYFLYTPLLPEVMSGVVGPTHAVVPLRDLFHRVQRVDKREDFYFPLKVDGFKARRINFTFRFVPDEYVVDFRNLPKEQKDDLLPYLNNLAKHSVFFKEALEEKESRI